MMKRASLTTSPGAFKCVQTWKYSYSYGSICAAGVARGCGWQHWGAWTNLGAYYIVGLPAAITLAFHYHLNGRVGTRARFPVTCDAKLILDSSFSCAQQLTHFGCACAGNSSCVAAGAMDRLAWWACHPIILLVAHHPVHQLE